MADIDPNPTQGAVPVSLVSDVGRSSDNIGMKDANDEMEGLDTLNEHRLDWDVLAPNSGSVNENHIKVDPYVAGSRSALRYLRELVGSLRKRTADGRHYVDPQSLIKACTRALIDDAVYECGLPQDKLFRITEYVLASGIITFAILVHIRKEQLIIRWIERSVIGRMDDDLPMSLHKLQAIDAGLARQFFEVQWEFKPVMLVKYKDVEIDDNAILPFDEDQHFEDRDTSIEAVHRVTMSSQMQRFIRSNVSLRNLFLFA